MAFNEYEKVQDTLMYLGPFAVKFNVNLAYKDKQGYRKFFYKEYKYQSKYIDTGDIVSIKRNIFCYLSINHSTDTTNFITIYRGDMPILRNNTTLAAKWLQDDTFKLNKENRLSILNDISIITQLSSNNAIQYEPVIIPDIDGDKKGIRISFNDTKNFVDIDSVHFFEFYELIRSLDMYTAAAAIIASLHITDEDIEVNRVDFDNSASEYNPFNKKKGWFDK